MRTTADCASRAWLDALKTIMVYGLPVCPRGMETLELQQNTFTMYMGNPVVLCPARKLSYTFLAAEALWILNGDNRVSTIARYNKNIAKFSDDGETFFGAYGPRIATQIEYIVDKLVQDKDTRQAVLTIWRENPPRTRDVPCTVAISFLIRNEVLNCHVFMRSSDAWLGLPYDCFNFSMLALQVACAYNKMAGRDSVTKPVELGTLYLTAASMHIYARDFDGVRKCLSENEAPIGCHVPVEPLILGEWGVFIGDLKACRDRLPFDLWRIRP